MDAHSIAHELPGGQELGAAGRQEPAHRAYPASYRRLKSFSVALVLAAMGISAIALLAASLSEFALEADSAAKRREEIVIANGLRSRMKELGNLVVPTAVWDDAVLNLDNAFNRAWAQRNIGQFFSAANGFNFAYVLDLGNRAVYGMENGEDVSPTRFTELASDFQGLIDRVRRAEATRTLNGERHEISNNLRAPIQVTAPKPIDGGFYFVTATLVQPDFGDARIQGERAPIIITGRQLDASFLAEFADRYLLEDVHVHTGNAEFEPYEAHASIKDENGIYLATIDWKPQTPGSALLAQVMPWTLFFLISLLAVALFLYRKERRVAQSLEESERQASFIAYHDAITGLPNRAYLERYLEDASRRAQDGASSQALHCLDLDHFKEINDLFGPAVGDEALRVIAEKLKALCKSGDICVRFGGDGFAVVQSCGWISEAEDLAAKLIEVISEPLQLTIGSRRVTCSVGIVTAENSSLDAREWIRRADLALHAAKEKGRARACLFDSTLDDELRSRHQLLDDLRADIGSEKFSMVYQPQIDNSGEVVGVEALVRWSHVTKGAISPAVFVPLAESAGLVSEIGNFTIRKALEDSRRWPRITVAVNVSATQIRTPGFASHMRQLALEAGVDPSRIEVEITEGVLLADDEHTLTTLQRLRGAGFSIALDDFGTGYSSLSYLRRFPITKIKIDRSFITPLGVEPGAEALVAAMVNLARALGLSVIAEGVETKEQRDHLLSAGCTQIQGYLASRPVEAGRIVELLEGATDRDR